ncbi:SDR family NAD(P)-dependent oxidoreductase [Streptomyces sp. NY05-11A]|uniref:SDR family NAD(P)-dependent oxidoreductase n=1 Tax=Streptomyces soliscabiei TaxID=588897 RepID=UPI0029BBFBA4|nr:SDR family NAD(P)-dependent oxidoreductase [Streptomyces sp. NY05-11A]MDX2676706.1 SDR family NAD(P)-dependent oxidoreductase [Streptomyces sp. NY05-11A]
MTATLSDLLGLADRTALVTGAGNGIARATALLLADAGCDVAVVDRDPAAAARTVTEVTAKGRKAVAIPADITEPTTPVAMVEQATAALGPISVAVNVVGGTAGVNKSFLDLTLDDFHRPLVLNLDSTFLSVQAEAIAMVRAGLRGTIVNVGSTSGVTGAPNLAAYGAANAGVIHFTKTAALELAPYGIRVNCLVPGTHWTVGTRAHMNNPEAPASVREFFTKSAAATPLGDLGEPGQTAGVALFLASDLSSYMTGNSVISDGGILHTTARPAFGGGTAPEAIRDYVGTVRTPHTEEGDD